MVIRGQGKRFVERGEKGSRTPLTVLAHFQVMPYSLFLKTMIYVIKIQKKEVKIKAYSMPVQL
jgi:hypothetical protein